MNWLDNLKLRVSWGQLGNNSIGNYEWQAVYATAPHYAFGNKEVPGLGMGSFSNYNLEWGDNYGYQPGYRLFYAEKPFEWNSGGL